jgi:hypothetical protein
MAVVALYLVLCLSDRNVILSMLPVLPVLWMMVQACNIIHPFFALPIAPVYALPAIPSSGTLCPLSCGTLCPASGSFCPPWEVFALLAFQQGSNFCPEKMDPALQYCT